MLAHVTIALAREADVEPIAQLSRDAIEQGLAWSWTPRRVLRSLRHADTNVVVARAGDAMAGFAIMSYGEQAAHLNLLAVVPSYQRQGVASALLHWLEATARVAGMQKIDVEARSDNVAARALYRAHGFMLVRERLGYYQGIDDAVVLAKTFGSAG